MCMRFAETLGMLAVLMACGLTRTSAAQCVDGGEWIPVTQAGTFRPAVYLDCVAAWDPDGAGPLSDLLIAGGTFVVPGYANTPPAIGAWDGAAWTNRGISWDPATSLAVDGQNQFIAGGVGYAIDGVPVSGIAQWNGAAWSALGAGLTFFFQGQTHVGHAAALATMPNGDVVAGGWFFDHAGGMPAHSVALWDGSQWLDMAGGLSQPYPGWGNAATISDLHVLADGKLIAAGGIVLPYIRNSVPTTAFGFAIWDGTTWSPMPMNGPTANPSWPVNYDQPRAVVQLQNGSIIAGASNNSTTGLSGPLAWRWTGMEWEPIDGLSGSQVFCMFVLPDGQLVVGGEQLKIGGAWAGMLARYDGSAWHRMVLGNPGDYAGGRVYDMAWFRDELIVVGTFSGTDPGSGSVPGYGWARWRPGCRQVACDSIDFNGDGLYPDTSDIDDFLSVFSGGPCSNEPDCADIDFNNDGLFPDTADIDSMLLVFSGGQCL